MSAKEEQGVRPARILIADDHPLIREGMSSMLANEPDLRVVGEAKDGLEALKVCRKLRPELVLMDVRMPKMDGLEATRKIKEACPQTSVLIVTTHESQEYLAEAIRAGAAGYVLKEATKGQLVGAVRRALEGESPMNEELAVRLLRRLVEHSPNNQGHADLSPSGRSSEERPAGPSPLGLLSPRELEVLRLMAQGKTNQQIAKDLLVSVSTTKKHVRRIISKLEVSDRTQAAVLALKLGVPTP
jgi:DNA-binding NarL/FixJ family response regulator